MEAEFTQVGKEDGYAKITLTREEYDDNFYQEGDGIAIGNTEGSDSNGYLPRIGGEKWVGKPEPLNCNIISNADKIIIEFGPEYVNYLEVGSYTLSLLDSSNQEKGGIDFFIEEIRKSRIVSPPDPSISRKVNSARTSADSIKKAFVNFESECQREDIKKAEKFFKDIIYNLKEFEDFFKEAEDAINDSSDNTDKSKFIDELKEIKSSINGIDEENLKKNLDAARGKVKEAENILNEINSKLDKAIECANRIKAPLRNFESACTAKDLEAAEKAYGEIWKNYNEAQKFKGEAEETLRSGGLDQNAEKTQINKKLEEINSLLPNINEIQIKLDDLKNGEEKEIIQNKALAAIKSNLEQARDFEKKRKALFKEFEEAVNKDDFSVAKNKYGELKHNYDNTLRTKKESEELLKSSGLNDNADKKQEITAISNEFDRLITFTDVDSPDIALKKKELDDKLRIRRKGILKKVIIGAAILALLAGVVAWFMMPKPDIKEPTPSVPPKPAPAPSPVLTIPQQVNKFFSGNRTPEAAIKLAEGLDIKTSEDQDAVFKLYYYAAWEEYKPAYLPYAECEDPSKPAWGTIKKDAVEALDYYAKAGALDKCDALKAWVRDEAQKGNADAVEWLKKMR